MKQSQFTDVQSEFIKEHYPNCSIPVLIQKMSKHFNQHFSYYSVTLFIQENGLKKVVGLTEEEKLFIREHSQKMNRKEMAELMSKTFNRHISYPVVKNYCTKNKIKGLNHQFQKGCISHNKGKKVVQSERAIATQFKKGNKPINYMPVGSKRTVKDGYLSIKIAEPNKWELEHRYVWEQANGKVPPGYCLFFLDQNKQNVTLDNLILISRKDLAVINKNFSTYENPDINKSLVQVSQLMRMTTEAKKKIEDKRKRINRKA